MKPILITLLLITLSTTVYGQSNQDKAKAYFKQANTEFTQQKYAACIATLNKVEGLLGKSNAMISSLRTKAYYNSNEFSKAKTQLNAFFKYKASDKLKNEMLTYIIKIDDKLEEIAQKKEQVRLAEIAAEEELIRKKNVEKERLRLLEIEKTNFKIAEDKNTKESFNKFISSSNNREFKQKAKNKIAQIKIIELKNAKTKARRKEIAQLENNAGHDWKKHSNLLRFRENGKYGFINKEGEVIIEALYDEVFDFNEGLSRIRNGQFWGLINTQNQTILSPTYLYMSDFKGNFSIATKKGSGTKLPYEIVIDKTGKVVYDGDSGTCLFLGDDGFFYTSNYRNNKIFNPYGKLIYTSASTLCEPYLINKNEVCIRKDCNSIEVINTEGFKTFEIKDFSYGQYITKIKGKYITLTFDRKINIYNEKGIEESYELKYNPVKSKLSYSPRRKVRKDYKDHFYNGLKQDFLLGLIAVYEDEKVGYINWKNELIIPIKHKEIDQFKNYRNSFNNGVIRLDDICYNLIGEITDSCIRTYYGKKQIVNSFYYDYILEGNPLYREIGNDFIKLPFNKENYHFYFGLLKINVKGNIGIIDSQANIIIPAIYKSISISVSGLDARTASNELIRLDRSGNKIE